LEVTPLSPVCVGYNRFDVDGSGGINLEEFRQGMKSTGSSTSITNDEVDLLFGLFDVDGSGTLELDEFESFSSANAM
jgi:Ca2+-binding EF-hand superfamily protein